MKLAIALILASALPAFADTGERGAKFIGLIRDNGCTMTEADAERILGGAGISVDESFAFVDVLVANGQGDFTADGTGFKLDEALCKADPAGDAALVANADVAGVPLSRVKTLGMPGVRANIAMFVMERRCSVELDGARDTRADMTDQILARARIDAPSGSPARLELERMVAEATAKPGNAYKLEDGWLTMIKCTPK